MAKHTELMARTPIRQEPSFEGDRKVRNMGELTRDIEEYSRPNRASDYAQPHVREAVATLEDEISNLAKQEIPEMQQRTRDIGNSHDMKRAQEFLNNTVTAAHDDTCKALDKVVGDARDLLARTETAVDAHKKMLQEEGQKIAMELEMAVQVLTKTVEWVEKAGPNLRNPKEVQAPTEAAS